MPQAGTAWVDVRANLNGFNRQLNAEMSGRRMRRMGVLGGAALGAGLTVAVNRAFKSTVGAAVQFESSFADVRKTVDTNARGFARLERGIRRMAKQIPTSADRLAEMAGVAGQLGIRAPDIIRFTRVVADLGETTNLEGEQAATTLARIANIMGTSSRDYRRLGSTIVELGNNLATTEAEITDMALRLAKAGVQVGLSEAQVLAFAGALSSVGIEAQAGGSAYARAFIRMSQAVDRGGGQLGRFARVAGMARAEFRDLFRRDASLAMVAFTEGLGRLQREGKSVFPVLEKLKLHDIRVRDALLGAAASGDLFRRSLRLGTEEWRRNTALAREASLRYETVAARWETLKNRARDFGIELGQRVLPELNRLMDILTDERLSGTEKFERISQEISRLVSTGLERAARIAVQSGPRIVGALASGIAQAWHQASPLARLFTAAAILRAVGGRGAVLRAGAVVGGHFAAGVAAGAATVGGGGGSAVPGMLGPMAGGFAGGALAGVGGRGRLPSAGYGPGRGGRLLYGPEFRYGAPVSQLGERSMRVSAANMLGSLRSAILPMAKRVGLAGLGIALADSVVSEFGRRARERSDDLLEAIGAKTGRTGMQRLNILGRLPGAAGDAFRPENPAERVLPVLRRALETRTLLSQREIADLEAKRDQLNLTEAQRKQYDRILSVLRTGSRLRFRVSGDMDPRALRQVESSFRALRSGALSNMRDILKVSRRNMRLIGETWGHGTNEGRRAAARNMRATADAITAQMARSGRVTRRGLELIQRLLRNADLTDPSRRMARRFGREWADGMNTSARITRRGLARMLAEARQMPGPMRKIALETWLAQIEQAKRGRRITVEEFRQMRSKVLATFPGMKTESRSTARAIARSLVNMAEVGGSAIATLVSNANSGLTGFGARPIRFSLKRVKEQKRQRGGTITPVPGVGSGDKVPALLEPGEVVVNREAVRAMGGPERVNRINSLIPRFQTGGIAGGFNVDGARPGFVPLMNFLNRMFGPIYVMSGMRPGSITTSGNVSNHASGRAVDISTTQNGLNMAYNAATLNATGVAARRMDALYAYMARWMPTSRVPGDFLWRTDTGGNHWNHIHRGITNHLADSAAAMAAFLSSLPEGAGFHALRRLTLDGPDGPLRRLGQAALDRVWRAATDRIAAAASVPTFGTGRLADVPHGGRTVGASTFGGPGDPGTGSIGYRGDNLHGQDAYAELRMGTALGGLPYRHPLTIAHGGRAVSAQKLDIGLGGAPVQGHETAIDLWYETANKLGLPDVWKGLVQITGAQRGGIIQRLASGALVGRTRAVFPGGGSRHGRVHDLGSLPANIREVGRWLRRPLDRRQRSATLRYAMRLIRGIGVPAELQQQLTSLSTNADTWAEFAQRAGALSYEMLYAERTPQIGPDGRPVLGNDGRPLFHEVGDPILDAERRPMTHFAEVNGMTEAGWTQRRLEALLTLRNRLVEAARIVRIEQVRVARLIANVRDRLKRLQQAIRRAGRERRRVERERRRQERLLERERDRLRRAERELESATGSLRTARLSSFNRRDPRSVARRRQRIERYGRRVAALQEEIPQLRASIGRRERTVSRLRSREDRIREQQRRRVIVRRNLRRMLGDRDSGLIGRRVSMDEYLPNVLGSGGDSFKGLITVQGLGGPMELFHGTPPEGMFGGEIFDAQQILRQLAVRPNPVPLPEPAEADAPDDSERNALLRQLLEESQRRFVVSQAQYRALEGFNRDFPLDRLPGFGGSFATGGVVPGAVGEARTIIAHGGERVLSVAEQRAGALSGRLEVIITDRRTIVTGPDGQEVRAIVRDETRRAARGAMMRTPGGAR